MAKAKQANHTAKELAAKAKAALQNKGGGKAGLVDRKGGAVGHAKYKCHICAMAAPDLKTMQARGLAGGAGDLGGSGRRCLPAHHGIKARGQGLPAPSRCWHRAGA